jgi:hypothetical protein
VPVAKPPPIGGLDSLAIWFCPFDKLCTDVVFVVSGTVIINKTTVSKLVVR